MNLQKTFLHLILLFVSFQFCFGQENLHGSKVNEFGKICSEDLMARFDNYFLNIHNDPTATGYIVFYGESSAEGRNLNFINYLANIYPNRRIAKNRLALVRGTNQSKMKIEFWITPAGYIPPRPTVYFEKEKIISTTRFDESWADFHNEYGKLDIYNDGFLDLGCDFKPNRTVFAKTLRANYQLTGYLVIYTRFGKNKKYADRIANFALKDLTRNYKVPANRLKTIYGGHRQEPAIELWFVPQGDSLPTLTPDKKSKE